MKIRVKDNIMIGVIYIVYVRKPSHFESIMQGDWKLAIQSAESLKKHMPDIHTSVFTNFETDPVQCFDNIFFNEPDPYSLWGFKYQCILKSPYDITLHLDADTYICDDFSEVFGLMDHFDLALPLSVTYLGRGVDKSIPICFPEPAGGFMLFKRNSNTDNFFLKVKDYVDNRRHGSDEPCLRKALYYSNIRYAIVPWEYNCLYIHPGYVFGKVKIMHGRRDTIKEDAEIMNTKVYDKFPPWKRIFTGNRLYLFKKTSQRKMEIVKEIPYQKEGPIRT